MAIVVADVIRILVADYEHGLTSGLLTTKQVSRVLGCSEATVKRLCGVGKLRGVRTPGGHWRIFVDSLVKLMNDSNVGQVGKPIPFSLSDKFFDGTVQAGKLLNGSGRLPPQPGLSPNDHEGTFNNMESDGEPKTLLG